MFFVVRFFVVSVIILSYIFVNIYRKKKASNKQRSKKHIIIERIVVILLAVCVCIPFEAPYIRFDSAADSVYYSTTKFNYEVKTVETDKTAFSVAHTHNNFHFNIITKYGDKYGFCDRHSHANLRYLHSNIDDGSDSGLSYRVTKLVDYDTNEKCYMITFTSYDLKDVEDIYIYDEQNQPIEKIVFRDSRSVFGLVVNDINETTAFVYDGQTYELD